MFGKELLLESAKVIDVVDQVTALVNECQDVLLEVCPIKKLQLVWRWVSLAFTAVDSFFT